MNQMVYIKFNVLSLWIHVFLVPMLIDVQGHYYYCQLADPLILVVILIHARN